MKEYFLQHLNKTKIIIDPDTQEIYIWCYHDKNYTLGAYYKIDKDYNLYLVQETEKDHTETMLF